MSDAPERIWLDSNLERAGDFVPCWDIWQTDDDVEYVRADIHDAVVAERNAALARVKALEARDGQFRALIRANLMHVLGWSHEKIDAAIDTAIGPLSKPIEGNDER